MLENRYKIGPLLAMANNGQLNSCRDIAEPKRRLVIKISVDLNVIGHEVKIVQAVAAKLNSGHQAANA